MSPRTSRQTATRWTFTTDKEIRDFLCAELSDPRWAVDKATAMANAVDGDMGQHLVENQHWFVLTSWTVEAERKRRR
jgi:hypothetical protein